MTSRREYTATVKHPTNFYSGVFTFTVTDCSGKGSGVVYVDARGGNVGFGCSRDYYVGTGIAADYSAIAQFAAEHGCTVGSISANPPAETRAIGEITITPKQ